MVCQTLDLKWSKHSTKNRPNTRIVLKNARKQCVCGTFLLHANNYISVADVVLANVWLTANGSFQLHS